jgi:hypothetical protein
MSRKDDFIMPDRVLSSSFFYLCCSQPNSACIMNDLQSIYDLVKSVL